MAANAWRSCHPPLKALLDEEYASDLLDRLLLPAKLQVSTRKELCLSCCRQETLNRASSSCSSEASVNLIANQESSQPILR